MLTYNAETDGWLKKIATGHNDLKIPGSSNGNMIVVYIE